GVFPELFCNRGRDAVGETAVGELLPQRGHQRVDLLADRLAEVVRLGRREAGERLRDLHVLLLVEAIVGDHAVGDEIVNALDRDVEDTLHAGRLDADDLLPAHPRLSLHLRQVEVLKNASDYARGYALATRPELLRIETNPATGRL